MSLSPMSHVEFTKWPCRPVDFRGQGPFQWCVRHEPFLFRWGESLCDTELSDSSASCSSWGELLTNRSEQLLVPAAVRAGGGQWSVLTGRTGVAPGRRQRSAWVVNKGRGGMGKGQGGWSIRDRQGWARGREVSA